MKINFKRFLVKFAKSESNGILEDGKSMSKILLVLLSAGIMGSLWKFWHTNTELMFTAIVCIGFIIFVKLILLDITFESGVLELAKISTIFYVVTQNKTALTIIIVVFATAYLLSGFITLVEAYKDYKKKKDAKI